MIALEKDRINGWYGWGKLMNFLPISGKSKNWKSDESVFRRLFKWVESESIIHLPRSQLHCFQWILVLLGKCSPESPMIVMGKSTELDCQTPRERPTLLVLARTSAPLWWTPRHNMAQRCLEPQWLQKRHWIYCPSRTNWNLNGKISFKWWSSWTVHCHVWFPDVFFAWTCEWATPEVSEGAKLFLSLFSNKKRISETSRGKTAKARAVNTPKASKTPVLPHQKACSGVSWAYPKVAPPPSQNLFPSPTNMTLPFLDAWKMC